MKLASSFSRSAASSIPPNDHARENQKIWFVSSSVIVASLLTASSPRATHSVNALSTRCATDVCMTISLANSFSMKVCRRRTWLVSSLATSFGMKSGSSLSASGGWHVRTMSAGLIVPSAPARALSRDRMIGIQPRMMSEM